MVYPIVEYAHKIGKNTADFTSMDMMRFNAWWMKQPRKGVVEAEIKQRLKRVVAIHERIKQGDVVMGKTIKSVKLQAAQKSRLSSNQVVDVEQAEEDVEYEVVEMGGEGEIDMEAELAVINEKLSENDIVADMGFTRIDVDALLWCINTVMTDYDMTGHDYEPSLTSLKEGLEGV